MTKRTLAVVVLAILVVVVGLILYNRSKQPKPVTAPQEAMKTQPAVPPSLLKPASLTEKAPDVYWAKFDTTKGSFVIKVTRAWAPMLPESNQTSSENGLTGHQRHHQISNRD